MPLDLQPKPTMMRDAMRAEMLDAETEQALARAWRDNRDEEALHRLVNAYTRLAISMASKYRKSGASVQDMTQEACVGLMRAAEKFDPDRGVRFSTYAVWWIKAALQDFVMRDWSLVRTGSTSSQKSLFFNMRRVQAEKEREMGGHVPTDQLHEMIAEELGVPLHDVQMMAGRMSGGDFSLNATQAGEEGREWVETLEDTSPQAAETVEQRLDGGTVSEWLTNALSTLKDRDRYIIQQRKLRDDPRTLDSLGQELGLSKERIRQLEARALKQLRARLEADNGPEIRAIAGT